MAVYLRSVAVGLCTLILFIVISPFIVLPILSYQYRKQFPHNSGEVGWDPVSLVKHSPLTWLFLCLAFALGFAWEYRRLAHARY